MALFGVLPPRNPLTDLHNIWHGWYVGDITEYPKWYINQFRGWPPRRGELLMVCAFLFVLSATRGQTAGPFWLVISHVSATVAFLCRLGQRYHNFRRGGQNTPKPPKIGPHRHFPAKMPKSYNVNISNSKSNQVEIWSSTGDHEVLIQKRQKIKSKRSDAWVTWPTFKFWDFPNISGTAEDTLQTSNFARILTVRDTKPKKWKNWPKEGVALITWPTFQILVPLLSLERLKIQTSNLARVLKARQGQDTKQKNTKLVKTEEWPRPRAT